MRNYYISSKLSIPYLKEKLSDVNKQLKELRLISIIIFILFTILSILREKGSATSMLETYSSLLVIIMCLLWGFIYIYSLDISILKYRSYHSSFDFNSEIESNDTDIEVDAILAKELEYELRNETRRLRQIKLLVFISIITTIAIVLLIEFSYKLLYI